MMLPPSPAYKPAVAVDPMPLAVAVMLLPLPAATPPSALAVTLVIVIGEVAPVVSTTILPPSPPLRPASAEEPSPVAATVKLFVLPFAIPPLAVKSLSVISIADTFPVLWTVILPPSPPVIPMKDVVAVPSIAVPDAVATPPVAVTLTVLPFPLLEPPSAVAVTLVTVIGELPPSVATRMLPPSPA